MENGTHYRTCHLCEAMCGVAIEVRDGHVASIKGDEDDPLSHGHICPKAVALQDLHEDPERLRKPVRRTTDGWLIATMRLRRHRVELDGVVIFPRN